MLLCLLVGCGAPEEPIVEPTAIPTSALALAQVAAPATDPVPTPTDAVDSAESEPASLINPIQSPTPETASETASGLQLEAYPAEDAVVVETPIPDSYPIAPATESAPADAYPVTQSDSAETDEPTPTPEPTATTADAYPVGQSSILPSATPEPITVTLEATTSAVGPLVDPALSGLVLKDEMGLWRVTDTGALESLLDAPRGLDWAGGAVAISPSLDAIGLVTENELFIYASAAEQFIPLIETPDTGECCFLDWLADGQWLFGTDIPSESVSTSGLAMYEQSGNTYTFLSETSIFGRPAFANGLVAYSEAGRAQIVDLTNQTLTDDQLGAVGKAWSAGWDSTGTRVAWLALQADELMSLTLFNRETQSTDYFHLYQPFPVEQWMPASPAWQPNGDWVAFEVIEMSAPTSDIWLVNVATEEERYVGAGSNPHWNRTGDVLVWSGTDGLTHLSLDQSEAVVEALSVEIVGWTESE